MVELLKRLQARDIGAQQQLRADLFPKVMGTCARMLRDPARAEETAEDIWMDFVYKHVDSVKEPRAIAAYVRMMTVRRCMRLREQLAKHQEITDNQEPADNPEPDILHHLDSGREQHQLKKCIAKLTQRARRILRLRYFHDMKLEQIGDTEKVSKQYAGRVVKQSLETLRTCMEAEA